MHPEENSQIWLHYGAAITASITSAGYGSIMSWTSPALTYLKSKESEIAITKEQCSWIAPLLPIGLMIGNFLNPVFINRIGRKWTLMMFAVPQIISWLIIYFTKDYNAIYVARIMGGIGYGGGVCAVTVYLSEIGTPKNRGIFLSMVKFSLSLGIFFTLLLGASLSYNYMNLGHLMMPLAFLVIFFFLPDSTYFLEKNKATSVENRTFQNVTKTEDMFLKEVFAPKEALVSKEDSGTKKDFEPNLAPEEHFGSKVDLGSKAELGSKEDFGLKGNSKPKEESEENRSEKEFLLREDSSCKENFLVQKNFLSNRNSLFKNDSLPKEDCLLKNDSLLKKNYHQVQIPDQRKKSIILKLKESGIWKLCSTSNNVKALTIIVCVVAQDALSGHMTLTYFSEQMLSYNGSLLSPKQGALFLSVMKLLSCVVATQVIEKMKRRTLYFSTGILASLSQGMVGIFFFLEEYQVNVSSFSFIPFVGLIIYEFSVSMGTSNLFYVFQGELFETDVKGLAVTFAKNMYMIFGFISIIMYQVLIESFSTYVLFFIFSVCGIILCFITVALLPETKGRSTQEIQLLLKKKTLF